MKEERAGEGESVPPIPPRFPLVSIAVPLSTVTKPVQGPFAAGGAVMHRPTPVPGVPAEMGGKRRGSPA